MDRLQLRGITLGGHSGDLRRRHAIIATSLVGMATMGAVSLYQTGMIRRLPDLPLRSFDSDKVNGADAAYRWGAPDATLAVMGCALNLPIAASGGPARADERPLLPIIAALKGTLDAGIAARYLYEMPAQRGAWSSYSIVAALVDFTVFGLTLPEARKAWAALRRG